MAVPAKRVQLAEDGAFVLRSARLLPAGAGFVVSAGPVSQETVSVLPTTWARKLAFSGNARVFVEVQGRAVG